MSFLDDNRIVPVVVIKQAEDALPTLKALRDGGINIAEVTFRTACAREAIALGVSELPDMLIGAGTVVNSEQCVQAIEAGAKFIVSPGFSQEVCEVCRQKSIPYVPGVVTPTEIMTAMAEGLDTLKFFPAGQFGGLKTLKALHAAFPSVRFMPTGGVDESNMLEFLKEDFIAAIGGSWMAKGTPEQIAAASRSAVEKLK